MTKTLGLHRDGYPPFLGNQSRIAYLTILCVLISAMEGCTTPYLQVVIPSDKTEVQAHAARLECKKASMDPTSPRSVTGSTMNVGGGISYTEGSMSAPEVDWVLYKDCMKQLGYKVRETEVFWFLGEFPINVPPRFVREVQE